MRILADFTWNNWKRDAVIEKCFIKLLHVLNNYLMVSVNVPQISSL
jgi:hypothetical protein